MGLPYSKEIHAAFDQVTPLVAAGFEVVQTTKNIAIVVAVIQVITTFTLILILFALLALLITCNPDMETERQQLITPSMQYLASWVYTYGRVAKYVLNAAFVVGLVVSGYSIWQALATGHKDPNFDEEGPDETQEKADGDKSKDAKDAKGDK